jgi:hypothetical protein
MAYKLEGSILEVCDCKVLCPCWIGETPDNGTCQSALAYHFERGTIDGVDVSGLTLATNVFIPGTPLAGNWREPPKKTTVGALGDRERQLADLAAASHLSQALDLRGLSKGTQTSSALEPDLLLARPVSQPRHFAVKIAVRVGYGPIAPRAEPIEETKETGIILAGTRSPGNV